MVGMPTGVPPAMAASNRHRTLVVRLLIAAMTAFVSRIIDRAIHRRQAALAAPSERNSLPPSRSISAKIALMSSRFGSIGSNSPPRPRRRTRTCAPGTGHYDQISLGFRTAWVTFRRRALLPTTTSAPGDRPPWRVTMASASGHKPPLASQKRLCPYGRRK
jgi:hypothetical protein